MPGVLKPYKNIGRVRGGAHRAARGAKDRAANHISKPAARHKGTGNFGEPSPHTTYKLNKPDRLGAGLVGAAVGIGVGNAVGLAAYGNKTQKNNNQSRDLNRARRKGDFSKSRAKLITDLATKAERVENKAHKNAAKRWPKLAAGTFAASTAAGGGLLYSAHHDEYKRSKGKLVRAQSSYNKAKKESLVKGMSISAFGVQHGDLDAYSN